MELQQQMNWQLTALILISIAHLLFFIYFLTGLRQTKRAITLFLTPAGENQPSPASQVWQSMVTSLITQFKTTLMGIASGASRQQKQAEMAIAEDLMAEQSPALSVFASAFPTLGKAFKKNPALASMVAAKLSGFLTPKAAGPPPAVEPSNGGGFAARLGRFNGG